jgi:hypothetical protein
MNRTVRAAGLGFAAFACGAAVAYALARVIQVAFFPEPDPRTVLVVTRIGFFWRALIAGYAGLLAAIGAVALDRRRPIERALPAIVVVTAAIATLQGLLVP